MTTTAHVHVDVETHRLLSRVQLAMQRKLKAEGRPCDARLMKNLVYALALERGAELLVERHCPEHASDVQHTARELADLFAKTNAGAEA